MCQSWTTRRREARWTGKGKTVHDVPPPGIPHASDPGPDCRAEPRRRYGADRKAGRR
ncbi:hypothetical protein [Streptomyces sp. NPDC096339]|uniref:hypothetical protein n=1 Tax=Streptomyces sp. NPDC096339 TaxID=3366086 RepID=UPI003804C00D